MQAAAASSSAVSGIESTAGKVWNTPGALPNFHSARLDVLRGLAILLVVAFHYSLILTSSRGDDASREWVAAIASALPRPLPAIADYIALPVTHGRYGVTLFFIISGYCIHIAYLKWRHRMPAAPTAAFIAPFIWRRFWRIYPPMLLALLLGWIAGYSTHLWAPAVLRHLGASLAMVRNFSPGSMLVMNSALWSVNIEWQLYLLFPFLLLLSRGSRWLLPIAAAGGAVSCFWVFGFRGEKLPDWFTQFPVRWWAEWLLGVGLAELHLRGRTLFPRPTRWVPPLGLAAAGALVTSPGSFFAWLLPRIALAALVECAAIDNRPLRGVEKSFAAIGICSYSIYLFHLPILDAVGHLLRSFSYSLSQPATWLGMLPLVGATIYGLGRLSHTWLEQTSVSLGERWWKRLQRPKGRPLAA